MKVITQKKKENSCTLAKVIQYYRLSSYTLGLKIIKEKFNQFE